ncbi:MAG: LysR family transcriptional regulator [Hyphomicrobiales bacterium]|nr:LysR family transcriptional regulator [Hyphomicrobiales bacterium]
MDGDRNDGFPLLETDLLRTFVAIADTGSFTRAADWVFRTPSAVSMQVKRLEEMLGRSLFLREGRSVSLTADGEALLSYARRMLRLNREAVSRFLDTPDRGVVNFGAPEDFGTRYLPGILTRFAESCPHVEVNVTLRTSVELVERFARGDLDLAVVTDGCVDEPPGPGELMHAENLVWVGLRGGIAHERDPLPLALAANGCPWRAQALAALDRAGMGYRVAYTSEHCAGQVAALLADLAIAPMTASLVAPPLRVLGAEEGLPPLGQNSTVLYRSANLDPAGKAFATHIVESFQAL